MNVIHTLIERNKGYAATKFSAGLRMMPSLKTMIIGCVDPRVDPFDILGLEPGEAAVIRNVGGRIYPSTMQTMGMLRQVAKAQGAEIGDGWNLILLHHTDCGINCLDESPEMLAKHFGVEVDQLGLKKIHDPFEAVRTDIAALRSSPRFDGGFVLTGMVYDVHTGRVEVVV